MGKALVCTPGLIRRIPNRSQFAACSCTLTSKRYWVHVPARAALPVGRSPLHPTSSQGEGCPLQDTQNPARSAYVGMRDVPAQWGEPAAIPSIAASTA